MTAEKRLGDQYEQCPERKDFKCFRSARGTLPVVASNMCRLRGNSDFALGHRRICCNVGSPAA